MEPKDDEWKDTTTGRYLNSGGYGVGYIKDTKIPLKPEVTSLLVL